MPSSQRKTEFFPYHEPKNLALDLALGGYLELYLTPKPGLVDLCDRGSHPDLSVPRMKASLEIVTSYLLELCTALCRGESLAAQVRLGVAAEAAMLEKVGTNCHRGYIFLSGLFLAASFQAPAQDEALLREAISGVAANFFERGECGLSNGSRARGRFQAGGIRAEALAGFPSLFEQALPVFREQIAAGAGGERAVFAMLGRLMQSVEDTTALHRCGVAGLRTLREDGRELERLVAGRQDHVAFLEARNACYVEQNLTMGGVADLLALAFAWLCHTGELVWAPQSTRPSSARIDRHPFAFI
jgi:triphosphoribosyl-dephospho-CoA synthetase